MKVLIFIILLKFVLSDSDRSNEIFSTKKFQKTQTEEDEFINWKKVQKKSYTTKESEENAADNYVMTKRKVEAFNAKSNETYKQDVQNYADQNPNELLKKKAGMKIPKNMQTTQKYTTRQPKHVGKVAFTKSTQKTIKNSARKIPDKINYTNSMLEVKDQQNCASCYVNLNHKYFFHLFMTLF